MSVRATSHVSRGVLFLTVLAGIAASPVVSSLQARPADTPAQTPQFRAGADVVPVYATVRDPDRGFVLDLKQDEFEIYDEGRKQAITQFSIATQPLSAVVLIGIAIPAVILLRNVRSGAEPEEQPEPEHAGRRSAPRAQPDMHMGD